MIEISVIVPVYNGEAYLQELIESVLASDLTNLELILINDGSHDGSADICEKYRKKDKRVKYYRKENGGIASSRNLGLKKAQGRYICFMDQDDYIAPDGLSKMFQVCEACNCDFCSADLFYWDGEHRRKKSIIEANEVLNERQCKEYCKYILAGTKIDYQKSVVKTNRISGAVWNYLFRNDFLTDFRLHFIQYVDYEDDLVFLVNCFRNAGKVCLIEEAYYSWRYGHESESRRMKYIEGFYQKRSNYRSYIVETLHCICENNLEYQDFLYYFDGYTAWKTLENEIIGKKGFRNSDLSACLSQILMKELKPEYRKDVLRQFTGYKKVVLNAVYRKNYLLAYTVLVCKLLVTKLLRFLQHYKWFLKLHGDISKL